MKPDETGDLFSGVVLIIAGALVMLFALGIELTWNFLWGIPLLVAGGALVLSIWATFRR
jgi:uncharacterized protein (DUF983 family)